MVFCGESIITEISVYVSFYMSEFIIQSTNFLQRDDFPFQKNHAAALFVPEGQPVRLP